jgi:hypothetical protein
VLHQSVGNAIFDFVQQNTGRELAPKITGMLIDLSLEEIQAYLSSYSEFKKKVYEAQRMLEGMKAAQPGMPQPMGQPGFGQ